MNIKFSGFYKSIRKIDWLDIPNFAVITGPNGSGKTQLLEMIMEFLTSDKKVLSNLTIEGLECNFEEAVYLKGDWGVLNIPAIDIAGIQSSHKQKWNTGFFSFDRPNAPSNSGYRETPELKLEYENFVQSLGKTKRHHVTYDEFTKKYPRDFVDVKTPINQQINKIFFNYRLSQLEAAADGLSAAEIISKIGTPPWEILREIIKVSGLPFEINDAAKTGLWDTFTLILIHTVTKTVIPFQDLSSGEKVLLSIIFYLYRSQEKRIFPKLLLMDEPDAHLHPSMTQQFLNVVKDVLVEKYGLRVIMTTHSPTTVVLTPEESLFEMSINEPRIQKSKSKNHSVSLLTAGLVFVGNGSKYFLVEDQVDVDFYNFVSNQLVRENKLNSDIPLIFIRASTNESSGGKSVVNSWVEKLRNSGLQTIINGLIDKDDNNSSGNGIFTIDRYSIENYLVDPIVIYATLMENEIAFEVQGKKFGIGEEYKLKISSQDILQEISDIICGRIYDRLSSDSNSYDNTKVDIHFNDKIILQYPKWLLSTKGKILLNNVCNPLFGSKVNFGSLFRSFKRLNFIPQDLSNKFIDLQSGSNK